MAMDYIWSQSYNRIGVSDVAEQAGVLEVGTVAYFGLLQSGEASSPTA